MMKFFIWIGVIILGHFAYGSFYIRDGQVELRHFRQNEVNYQQGLPPRTEIWGKGQMGANVNDFTEISWLPVFDQVLGKSGPKQKGEKSDHQFWINEATLNARWEFLNLTLGRQIWHFGDGNLISDQSWHPVRQFFDGGNIQVKTNYNQLNLLYADIETIRSDYKNQSNKFVYGFYHQLMSYDLLSFLNLQFDFYYLQYRNDYIMADSGDNITYYKNSTSKGIRFHIKSFNYHLKGEYIYQTSLYSYLKSLNRLYTVQLGGEWDIFKIYFKFFDASKNYVPYFSEDHFSLGSMGLFQMRNIKSYGVDLTYKSPLKTDISFLYFMYDRKSYNQIVFRPNGDHYSTDRSSRYLKIGSEFNVNISYQGLDNLLLILNTGMFLPGEYIKDIYSDSKIYQFVLGARISI